jgi:hypothetical protein
MYRVILRDFQNIPTKILYRTRLSLQQNMVIQRKKFEDIKNYRGLFKQLKCEKFWAENL